MRLNVGGEAVAELDRGLGHGDVLGVDVPGPGLVVGDAALAHPPAGDVGRRLTVPQGDDLLDRLRVGDEDAVALALDRERGQDAVLKARPGGGGAGEEQEQRESESCGESSNGASSLSSLEHRLTVRACQIQRGRSGRLSSATHVQILDNYLLKNTFFPISCDQNF